MRLLWPLLRRRFRFELQPLRDVARLERSGVRWRAYGSDPSFVLDPGDGAYPGGAVLIESVLERKGENRTAKLYYDAGAGFGAAAWVFVPVSAAGTIQEVLRLPQRVVALRWDPMESMGEFSQRPIVMTTITWLESAIRMARQLWQVKASRPGRGAGRGWREFAGMLANLETEYAATGHLRNQAGEAPAPQPASPVIGYLRPNEGRLLDVRAGQGAPNPYRFALDRFDEQEIAGWVVDSKSPQAPVELDLYLDGEFVERKAAALLRTDVAAAGYGGPNCGFSFAIPPRLGGRGVFTAALCPSGTRVPLDGHSYLYTARDVSLRGLVAAAGTLDPAARELTVLRRVLLPRILEQLRTGWARLPDVLALPEQPAPEAVPEAARVDVIVPAYRGLDETRACIESVLSARVDTAFELIVINDCSPEPHVTAALRELSARHGFMLIENAENLGFVRTANKGMMLHADRDVVLLNSDTVVADGWLDRLREAACRDPNIATATPFSNRATICSFPLGTRDNELPDGVPLAELSAACAKVNHAAAVDIPTAVGFCMYIRRAALREAGYFDEALWGKGYCEENDFCLRAGALGWRHVIACDTFVAHHGSVSFSGERASRVRGNLETLNRMYPDYAQTIARFERADPIAPARRRLFVELARARAARYMLFIQHAWSGGAEVAAMELAERLEKSGEAVLWLSAPDRDTLALRIFGNKLNLEYTGAQRYDALADDLRQLRIWHAQVHHLGGFGPEIYRVLAGLAVPYDVTVHDYFAICPRINLIDGSERYCGEPEVTTCNACIASNGTHESCRELYQHAGADVGRWRTGQGEFLERARMVIAPSHDAGKRIGGYFPRANIAVKPHPEPLRQIKLRAANSDGPVAVAVIGAIGVHKGFNVLKACAEDALRRSLPLKFVVVGYTCDDASLRDLANVTITGKYERAELGKILAEHDCSLAGFFSVWPETFSYTLSEALTHGLFPIAFDLGAQAERLRDLAIGAVMPFPGTPSAINDILLREAKSMRSAESGRRTGQEYPAVLADYYQLAGSCVAVR